MSTKFRNLKNDLKDLEKESNEADFQDSTKVPGGNSKTANYILLMAFIAALVFYVGSRVSSFELPTENPISDVVQSFSDYDPDLLDGMGTWMTEMGYGVLTHEELSNLRDDGVTATETQRVRDLGFTSITLDQLVDLRRAGVSASEIAQLQDVGYADITVEQLIELENANVSPTYARMMRELGYSLTAEDLAETRRSGVTANFTSRMMDLGYTFEELTKENLMRLRSVEVTDRLAERLIQERGERPTIDELVRYRISNQ